MLSISGVVVILFSRFSVRYSAPNDFFMFEVYKAFLGKNLIKDKEEIAKKRKLSLYTA